MDGTFAHGIESATGNCCLHLHGTDVDNSTAVPGFPHQPDFIQAAEEGPFDIHIGQFPVELIINRIQRDISGIPAGVVDGNIKTSEELFHTGEEVFDPLFRSEIGTAEMNAAGTSGKFTAQGFRFRGIAPEMQNQIRARFSKRTGDSPSDSFGSAGHENTFSRKITHHSTLRR